MPVNETTDYGIHMDGAPLSEHKTMLFQVTLGGSYDITVSATNHVEAVLLAAKGDHLDGMPWDDELSVSVYTEDAARKATFWDEDTGRRTTTWEEWLRDQRPRVLGCSEF